MSDYDIGKLGRAIRHAVGHGVTPSVPRVSPVRSDNGYSANGYTALTNMTVILEGKDYDDIARSFVCVVYEDNFVRANLSEPLLLLLLFFTREF